MGSLLTRALAACTWIGAGAATAYALSPGLPAWIAGLAVTVAGLSVQRLTTQHLRMRRLMRWMAGPSQREAPVDPGVLGELGYAVERALRLRDEQTAFEQQRLAQFLRAIEASPNGVLLLDAGDHIEWFNPVAAEHFGFDAARDHGQRITNLVRAPAFVSYLQSGAFEGNVSFQSPRGGAVLSVSMRMYGTSMKLALSQDITVQKRNARMLRDFVANVSHEIRSPLTVLAGFLETMASLPLSEVERERVLALMRQQTTRMQALVTDLLALAQIEGAAKPPADTWVEVSPLLERLKADTLASDHAEHAIAFDLDDTPAALNGIESELFSAFWNLISNALRYTPDGGAVAIDWRVQADGTAQFSVTDNGVGVAQEHISRLTERFYRVDESRSRETGGTGLGLAIVKHVVQRHGGELLIDSALGKGSVMRIVLPAHRVRTAEPTPLEGVAGADTQTRVIAAL